MQKREGIRVGGSLMKFMHYIDNCMEIFTIRSVKWDDDNRSRHKNQAKNARG